MFWWKDSRAPLQPPPPRTFPLRSRRPFRPCPPPPSSSVVVGAGWRGPWGQHRARPWTPASCCSAPCPPWVGPEPVGLSPPSSPQPFLRTPRPWSRGVLRWPLQDLPGTPRDQDIGITAGRPPEPRGQGLCGSQEPTLLRSCCSLSAARHHPRRVSVPCPHPTPRPPPRAPMTWLPSCLGPFIVLTVALSRRPPRCWPRTERVTHSSGHRGAPFSGTRETRRTASTAPPALVLRSQTPAAVGPRFSSPAPGPQPPPS